MKMFYCYNFIHTVTNVVSACSLTRRPIAPTGRSRRLKQATLKATLSNLSDEENTSEYSHPPSSQCSTLESNPDLLLSMNSLNCKRPLSDSQDVSNKYNQRQIFVAEKL